MYDIILLQNQGFLLILADVIVLFPLSKHTTLRRDVIMAHTILTTIMLYAICYTS